MSKKPKNQVLYIVEYNHRQVVPQEGGIAYGQHPIFFADSWSMQGIADKLVEAGLFVEDYGYVPGHQIVRIFEPCADV
jgi:hypothetical protein